MGGDSPHFGLLHAKREEMRWLRRLRLDEEAAFRGETPMICFYGGLRHWKGVISASVNDRLEARQDVYCSRFPWRGCRKHLTFLPPPHCQFFLLFHHILPVFNSLRTRMSRH